MGELRRVALVVHPNFNRRQKLVGGQRNGVIRDEEEVHSSAFADDDFNADGCMAL